MIFSGSSANLFGQNETTKWFFGQYAGLNFSTNPPSIIQTSTLSNIEGSASIADANGNLLFYTNGSSVYNQQNVTMANGSGLFGNFSSTQAALILKQPGSTNLYYIFTSDYSGGANGNCYSIIDMNLAAGMGSVTIKNVQLYQPSTEKLTAARHCNGVDFWILTHELNSNVFRNFLLTSTGVNTVAVVSSVGSAYNAGAGYMKTSLDGKKVGSALFLMNMFEVYDFNQSTGVVSNPLSLSSGTNAFPYGCEFSPDGTKFYGTASNFNYTNCSLYQWNLCAGSNSAVVASQFAVTSPTADINGMQLAPNGKIYIARNGTQFLDAINSPDFLGSACNYQAMAQSIAPHAANLGLPNQVAGLVKAPLSIAQGLGCNTATFSPPSVANPSILNCNSGTNSVTSITWFFGDPMSGPLNTSSVIYPIHTYSATGNYTAHLVINFSSCASETITQVISILTPTISIQSPTAICSNVSSATVSALGGTGQYSYLWMPSAQTTSVATNLVSGSYTVSILDGTNCMTNLTISVNPIAIASAINTTANCSIGSATVSVFGGSNNYNYAWSVGGVNTPTITGLLPGIYSVTVNDLLNNCTLTNTVQLNTLSSPTINVLGKNLICLGETCTLTALGADSYSWSNSISGNSLVTSPTITTSYTILGTNTVSGCSSKLGINIIVSPCTGVESANRENNIIRIYPNPSVGIFTLACNGSLPIKISDVYGRIILEFFIESEASIIDLTDFEDGIYILHAFSEGKPSNFKILKGLRK